MMKPLSLLLAGVGIVALVQRADAATAYTEYPSGKIVVQFNSGECSPDGRFTLDCGSSGPQCGVNWLGMNGTCTASGRTFKATCSSQPGAGIRCRESDEVFTLPPVSPTPGYQQP